MLNRENGLFRGYTDVNDAEATMDLVKFLFGSPKFSGVSQSFGGSVSRV